MSRSDLTLHAQMRAQQRGISELQIELLRVFGEDFYQKGGTCMSYIPEKTLGQLRSALDKLDTVAMVKDGSDKAITLMHMSKRGNTRRGCA
jgi:hypothetical protein